MNNHLVHINNELFGSRLKSLREERRMTMGEMAMDIKIPKSSLSYYESGNAIPSLDKTYELAEYFGVSLDYLTGRSEIRQDTIKTVGDIADLLVRLTEYDCINLDINSAGRATIGLNSEHLNSFLKLKSDMDKHRIQEDYKPMAKENLRYCKLTLDGIPANKMVTD